MALNVTDRLLLIFGPNHSRMVVGIAGAFDWSGVTRIKILGIEGSNE